MRRSALAAVLLAATFAALPAHSALETQPGSPGAATPTAAPAKLEEKLVATRHSIALGGREIRYTATAGTLVLKDEAGKDKASMFYVAYVKDGEADVSKRSVTFTFNGGPGSSSVWLHLGAFGPRRVAMTDEGWALPPPSRLVDNEESLLDLTDLVFIDPVTTGFSRPAPGENANQFHGVQEDVKAVAELIRLWTVRNGRWGSPKFLAGESYGTTRAAGLAGYLQSELGIYLNGVTLISTVLQFQTLSFNVGNDLPYPLYLPSYTATAWFHKKLPADLQVDLAKAIEESKRFAAGEYTLALLRGNRLSSDERRALAGKLSRLTGLSVEYLLAANLRPVIEPFTKELLRSERTTVGRLDSRFRGLDLAAVGAEPEVDPSYAAIKGEFTSALNAYVKGELGFSSDLNYEILTDKVRPWSFEDWPNQYVNVAEKLREAMAQNPALRVFVGCGTYDLATPFFAAEYTFDHLGFDPTYTARTTLHRYGAGHMMYIRAEDRRQLKRDLAEFYRTALGG